MAKNVNIKYVWGLAFSLFLFVKSDYACIT